MGLHPNVGSNLLRHEVTLCQGLLRFAHITTIAFKAVRLGCHPAQTGICIGIVLEQIPPLNDRKLRYDHCRFSGVAGLDNLKQISTLVHIQFHQTKVVDNQQIVGR